jgi:hypothetical protein
VDGKYIYYIGCLIFQGNGTEEVVCCGWEVHTLYRLSNISGEWYRRSCVQTTYIMYVLPIHNTQLLLYHFPEILDNLYNICTSHPQHKTSSVEVHTLYRLSNISGEWYRRSCVLWMGSTYII